MKSSSIKHLAVAVIALGAVTSFLGAKRGDICLSAGEERTSFMSGGCVCPLGFAVRLERFDMGWNDAHKVTVAVKGGVERTFDVSPGNHYAVEGTPYSFDVRRYIPDFKIGADKKAYSESGNPNNPALLVEISKGGKTEDRWLYSRFPDFAMGTEDPDIRLVYRWEGSLKEAASGIAIVEGGRTVLRKTIRVNMPVTYNGFTFYQSGYDPAVPDLTRLEVVRDPGVIPVFAGFILLNAGAFLMLAKEAERWRKL